MRRKKWLKPTRNYDSIQYTNWRKAVLERDGYRCQFPNCNKIKRLQIHHIKRYADVHLMRYNVGNGITLCYEHHNFIKNKEEYYERLFKLIILRKIIDG